MSLCSIRFRARPRAEREVLVTAREVFLVSVGGRKGGVRRGAREGNGPRMGDPEKHREPRVGESITACPARRRRTNGNPGGRRSVVTVAGRDFHASVRGFRWTPAGRVRHFPGAWFTPKNHRVPRMGLPPSSLPPQPAHASREGRPRVAVGPAEQCMLSDLQSISPPIAPSRRALRADVLRCGQGRAQLMRGQLQVIAQGHVSC